jgi:hypothetical protein
MPLALVLILIGIVLYIVFHGVIATLGLVLLVIGVAVLIYDLVATHSRRAP